MLYIYAIQNESLVDGPGIRSAIFFSGCPHHCKGCHNPDTWDMKHGTKMSDEEIIAKVHESILNKSVTFTGGDPVHQYESALDLAKKLHREYKDMILYTGYSFGAIKGMCKIKPKFKEFLSCFKYVVPEKFVLEERDLSLYGRGSKNQRIYSIDTTTNPFTFTDISDIWDREYASN